MKNILYIVFVLFTVSVFGQDGGKKFYYADLKWTIILPSDFKEISITEGEVLEQKGIDHMEKALDEELDNLLPVKNIFSMRKTAFDFFEANILPYKPSDGNYEDALKNVWDVMNTSYKNMVAEGKVKIENTTEIVGGLKFYKNTVIIELPNKMTMHTHMYSRLFGNKDLTVNILYVDKGTGERLMKSWHSSIFK